MYLLLYMIINIKAKYQPKIFLLLVLFAFNSVCYLPTSSDSISSYLIGFILVVGESSSAVLGFEVWYLVTSTVGLMKLLSFFCSMRLEIAMY